MQTNLQYKQSAVLRATNNLYRTILVIMALGTVALYFVSADTISIMRFLVNYMMLWIPMLALCVYVLVNYLQMQRNDFKLIRVNDQHTGFWLTSYGFSTDEVFISFDWLTINVQSNGFVQLIYSHAFKFKKNGSARLLPGKAVAIRQRWFDEMELRNFLATFTYLNDGERGEQPKMAPLKDSEATTGLSLQKTISLTVSIFVAVMLVAMFPVTYQTLTGTAHNYHRSYDLKVNKTYHSRFLDFKINHVYGAKSTDNKPLMIVNMTVNGDGDDDNYSSLGLTDFDVYRHWTPALEAQDKSYDSHMSDGFTIKTKSGAKKVINSLDDGFSLSDTSASQTFNVVVKRPKNGSFDLVYAGFNFDYKNPSKDDDTSIVWHVKKSQLEELK